MSRDRRPPSSRNPWEGIGRGGSAGRGRERKVFGVTFNDTTLTNAAAPADDSWKGKSSREIMEEMNKVMREAMMKPFVSEFTIHLNGEQLAGRGTMNVPGHRHSRLEEAERAARGPVEKYLLKTKPGVAWDDVIGNLTARAHLVEAIEHPVRHAELYRHYGKKPTKGVLLYGPPGCGKTMFGKAAASVLAELHGAKAASFLSIKAPELQSGWVGETERTIRQIFAYARAYKALHDHPLVVFIDEADAILPNRDGRATWFQESNVATFLTEMDGIEDSGALVILATNRPDAIDSAVLRDGRIDRKVKVERPDRRAAQAIVARALVGVPVAGMHRQTVSISGMDGASMFAPPAPPEPIPSDEVRAILATEAADALFAPDAIVAQLATDQGARFVRLSDIVNGAMLVGLVEQAKGNAFRRDLAAGGAPSGLTPADLLQAVDAVVQQNRGLNHAYAVEEIAVRDGFRVAQVVPQGAAPPRYTLDAADNVVRVQ